MYYVAQSRFQTHASQFPDVFYNADEDLFLSLWPFFAVYADGGICLDILQNRWSPTYDVSAILTSIQVCFLTVLR